jgi:hypothetical protein
MFDVEGERAFFDTADDVFKGRTVIIISHNEAVQKFADKVYTLKDGRLEDGSHIPLASTYVQPQPESGPGQPAVDQSAAPELAANGIDEVEMTSPEPDAETVANGHDAAGTAPLETFDSGPELISTWSSTNDEDNDESHDPLSSALPQTGPQTDPHMTREPGPKMVLETISHPAKAPAAHRMDGYPMNGASAPAEKSSDARMDDPQVVRMPVDEARADRAAQSRPREGRAAELDDTTLIGERHYQSSHDLEAKRILESLKKRETGS